MNKIIRVLVCFMLPINVYAMVFGGSNLGLGGYPSNSCTKPIKPTRPYTFDSQWEIDSYNREVDRYNSNFRDYIDCIKEYLDNADNDIKRIKEKAQEAIDEANY